MVCPRCGSEDIRQDANAHWSIPKQAWVVSEVFGDITCNDCCDDYDYAEKIEITVKEST
jgi:hypothetical protein